MSEGIERATLGGGCFWCLEAVFEQVEGVEHVVSGYAGGDEEDPTYRQVCSGNTGHAEVVQVEFLPETISYRELLEIFFAIHDPTTPNRQGNDVGPQYRSIILTHSEEQRRVADEAIERLEDSGEWDHPIVTEVAELERFWPAEESHQEYYRNNPGQPYCQVVISPKVAKFRRQHAERIAPEYR